MNPGNIDDHVVKDFGVEWSTYNQTDLPQEELQKRFDEYFSVFPWESLPPDAIGFDLGCGSGRWDKLMAPRVSKLYCIDASEEALNVARQNMQFENIEFICASVDRIPLEDNSMDFGYSLGVLHHVPDTEAGIQSCVKKLKPGAPFLVYLYYAFDNRPSWFRMLWKCSDILRRIISKMPSLLKHICSNIIAVAVYLPLARFAKAQESKGKNVYHYPLAYYRDKSFYTMRTDAYDRFCTRLEQRFTKQEIRSMMEKAGLKDIVFGDCPFWCAVGYKNDERDLG